EADLRASDLVRRRSPDLADSLDDVVESVDVAFGKIPARSVQRQVTVEPQSSAGCKRPSLPLLAEAVVLQLQADGDREAVVHLRAGVGVGTGPTRQGDGAELFWLRPELGHVAPGDHGEHLAGSEQADGREVLVVGPVASDAVGGPTATEPPSRPTVERPEDE